MASRTRGGINAVEKLEEGSFSVLAWAIDQQLRQYLAGEASMKIT
jgi:hypothetical protein